MSIFRFTAKSQDYLQDIEIKTCISIDKKLILIFSQQSSLCIWGAIVDFDIQHNEANC